jgi:hypothetical protein
MPSAAAWIVKSRSRLKDWKTSLMPSGAYLVRQKEKNILEERRRENE